MNVPIRWKVEKRVRTSVEAVAEYIDRREMLKPKVYVETSVVSYLAARHSKDAVTAGRQIITRQWWNSERVKYRLVISEAVEVECERGDPEIVKLRRGLLKETSLFPLDERILGLARLLIVPGAIPENAGPDAVHIAAAAVEECDFLLTWNFRHIANVRIRREVERILTGRGYAKTTICTPEELI
jgi:hypothetical protein